MDATQDCVTSSAGVAFHQANARREFEDVTGRTLMPWTWILNTCATAQCLNAQHMVVVAPTKIAYPAGVCVYCGMGAGTKDHLIPRGKSGEARRAFVATVPACGECNSRINDHPSPSVAERRKVAHERLRKAKKKLLESPDWTDEEMAEFGPMLRNFVLKSAHDKATLHDRLEWPTDPLYDIRAFQRSGIEDPVALGLCDPVSPEEAAMTPTQPLSGPQNAETEQ